MGDTVAEFYLAHAEDGRAVLRWRNTASGSREPLVWIVRLGGGDYFIADDVLVPQTRACAGYLVTERGDTLVNDVMRNWQVFHAAVLAELRAARPSMRTRAVA